MVAQFIAILLVLWVMFGSPLAKLGLYYLSFLPIIWIAMRQGIGRVSGGILLFNFGVVLSLRVFNADSVATVNLGTLMLAVSFTGLIVGSAVSERHRIGNELHEHTLYLHSLIENSPFGIVVLDPLRRVQLCNAAFQGLFTIQCARYVRKDSCVAALGQGRNRPDARTLGTGVCRAACS